MILLRRKIAHGTLMTLLLFFFVFAPPLIPNINMIIVVSLLSFVLLITAFERKDVMNIVRNSDMLTYSKWMLVSWVYVGGIMLYSYITNRIELTNYLKTGYRFMLISPVMFSCIVLIISYAQKNRLSINDMVLFLVIAALIQAFITLAMLTFPDFRQFLVNLIYVNTGDVKATELWHLQTRYYAFSHSVKDTFGYATGLLASLPLFYAVFTGKYRFALLSVLLLIVPFFNSRTGLLVFVVCSLFAIPMLFFPFNRKKIRVLLVIIAVVAVMTLVYGIVKDRNPRTVRWIQSGIDSILGVLQGSGNKGTIGVLFDRMWYFPPSGSLSLFFGTGHTVAGVEGFVYSDIGYVNDVWLAGIIGSILIYLPITLLFCKTYLKQKDRRCKVFVICLALIFYLVNFKTMILNYNAGTAVVLLLVFLMNFQLEENLSLKVKNV